MIPHTEVQKIVSVAKSITDLNKKGKILHNKVKIPYIPTETTKHRHFMCRYTSSEWRIVYINKKRKKRKAANLVKWVINW